MLSTIFPRYPSGFGHSIFAYPCCDQLEELKEYAAKQAVADQERQFIVQMGDTYVLYGFSYRTMDYFQGLPLVARFAASGKETTPKTKS